MMEPDLVLGRILQDSHREFCQHGGWVTNKRIFPEFGQGGGDGLIKRKKIERHAADLEQVGIARRGDTCAANAAHGLTRGFLDTAFNGDSAALSRDEVIVAYQTPERHRSGSFRAS